jgi:surfeit locus 1 family protein
MRRWPLVPTLLVGLAVLTMIGLGFWQLHRKAEKEALIAQYTRAANLPAISYPSVPIKTGAPLFRQSSVICVKVAEWQAVAGTNVSGKSGFAHLARCQTGGAEGPGALVAVGWSNRPQSPDWDGGPISGIIAPDNKAVIRLVASSAVTGLDRLAPPSIDAIPNNHFLYAIQWFFFASAAAVMYLLAARRRWLDAIQPPPT